MYKCEKIAKHTPGQCVYVTLWGQYDASLLEDPDSKIGIILDHELIMMYGKAIGFDTLSDKQLAPRHPGNEDDQEESEYLYRVLVDGSIEELWEYEIKLVNPKQQKYNTNTKQT